MMKWSSMLAIPVMTLGLYAMPAAAIDGTVNGLQLDTVTCLNHITGEAAVGQITGGGFNCSALGASQGDSVGVVLNGITTDGPIPGEECTNPTPVQEQEPNDGTDTAQVLPGPCVLISGQTSGGTPEAPDIDAFRLNLSGSTTLQFTLTPTGAQLGLAFFDSSNPSQPLGVCAEQSGTTVQTCQLTSPPSVTVLDIVVFGVGTPGSYTLNIAAVSQAAPPSASRASDGTYKLP